MATERMTFNLKLTVEQAAHVRQLLEEDRAHQTHSMSLIHITDEEKIEAQRRGTISSDLLMQF